jgi:hypothetical protein
MRIGRRETKHRLTGLTFPTVLGTGGGGATWTVGAGDKALASSALQYLENRRVLYDPFEVEIPHACITSAEEIRARLASFIADSELPELRNPLRAIQAACRQFLTDVQAIENRGVHFIDVQRGGTGSWLFNQALGEFRARVGTCVAVIIETFDIDADEHLVKIMPPVVNEESHEA